MNVFLTAWLTSARVHALFKSANLTKGAIHKSRSTMWSVFEDKNGTLIPSALHCKNRRSEMRTLLNFFEILQNTLDFCRHSPLEFQRKKPVQGFLTVDGKPGDSVSKACSDEFIPVQLLDRKCFCPVECHIPTRSAWSAQQIKNHCYRLMHISTYYL